MNTVYILLLVIMIPVFLSMMFIPYWTRKTESFGVSIPEEVYNSKELKGMRKQYAVLTGFLSVAVTIIFFLMGSSFSADEELMSLLFSGIVFAFIVFSFVIYLVFHRKMKTLKQHNKWAAEKSQLVVVDTAFRKQRLTHSNLWFIISFLVVLVTVFLTFQHYQAMPDQIPTKYNFDGEVTNSVEKSYRSVLVMPIIQVYLTLLFIFINTIIAKAKQQVSAQNPEDSMKKNVVFRRRWSAYVIMTGIAVVLLLAFIQLSSIYSINNELMTIIPLIFTVGVVAGSIILSITTGQGGSRVQTATTGENGTVIDRDDDRYWKLGVIYFNPNDPSLFLEKRFGVGWTVNLARPLAWVFFLVIIGLAVGIPLLMGL
ncbi:DUF1648 domain-containing protein [Bacillus salacetis]|uniref:DUF1648 domain-containing protein n=1 Tax=Bacillus salacetis TaxID=2315464 RepID=A0A3A1QNQ7_9BACI|nr:DUF5808 domain-containing protein [Bacillus salacetis]RIW28702.1 DUF1648 domain-containing protein [Bacillus salacetis]